MKKLDNTKILILILFLSSFFTKYHATMIEDMELAKIIEEKIFKPDQINSLEEVQGLKTKFDTLIEKTKNLDVPGPEKEIMAARAAIFKEKLKLLEESFSASAESITFFKQILKNIHDVIVKIDKERKDTFTGNSQNFDESVFDTQHSNILKLINDTSIQDNISLLLKNAVDNRLSSSQRIIVLEEIASVIAEFYHLISNNSIDYYVQTLKSICQEVSPNLEKEEAVVNNFKHVADSFEIILTQTALKNTLIFFKNIRDVYNAEPVSADVKKMIDGLITGIKNYGLLAFSVIALKNIANRGLNEEDLQEESIKKNQQLSEQTKHNLQMLREITDKLIIMIQDISK